MIPYLKILKFVYFMGFQAIVCWGILLIAADLAFAEQKPAAPAYYQPPFSHYFKPASTFYSQPTGSLHPSQLAYPHFYPSISPYYSLEKSEHGIFFLLNPYIINNHITVVLIYSCILLIETIPNSESSEEEESPFAYTCKYVFIT